MLHYRFLSNSFLYLIHTLSHYDTLIVLLFYSMLVIYISVRFCIICGRGQHIDEKYDQCILYFLKRHCQLLGFKSSWLM